MRSIVQLNDGKNFGAVYIVEHEIHMLLCKPSPVRHRPKMIRTAHDVDQTGLE